MTALEDYQKLAEERDLLELYDELGDFGGPDDYDPIVAVCMSLVDSIPTLPNTSKRLTQELIALKPTDPFSPIQWASKRAKLFEVLKQVELEEAERLETSLMVVRKLEAEDRLEVYRSKLVILAGALSKLTPLYELVSKHCEAVLEAADYYDGLSAEEAVTYEELARARDNYFLSGTHEVFESYIDASNVFDLNRVPGNAKLWERVDELNDRIQVALMLREVTS